MGEFKTVTGPESILVATGGTIALLGCAIAGAHVFAWPGPPGMAEGLARMSIVSAAGYIACGLGLISAVWQWEAGLRLSGAVALAIGLGGLIHWAGASLVGIELRPDRARLVPSAYGAFCFLLAGIALLLLARNGGVPRRPFALALLGSVLLGLAVVVLFEYAAVLVDPDGDHARQRLAIQGAIAILLLSGGMLALAWRGSVTKEMPAPQWLPIPISVALASGTVTLWHILEREGLPPLPSVVLASGLMITMVVGFSVFCAQAAWKRSCWCEAAIAGLRRESAERQRMEKEFLAEQQRAQNALEESEERFRRIFEDGLMGTVLFGTDLQILKVNHSFCRMLGYGVQELVGQTLPVFWHAEEAAANADQLRKVLEGELVNDQAQRRYLTKNRKPIWMDQSVSVVRDGGGKPLYGVIMIQDIDERKNTEEKLLLYQDQLQSLASELALSEERERRQIATVLHDRVSQTLAFAKLRLGSLSVQPDVPASFNAALRAVQDEIEGAIADTRSLTVELSPPVLYELGLVAAIEWLALRFQHEHGLSVRFFDDGEPKPLDDKFRVVLFQAVRELLVNAVKHSQASAVEISSRRDGDAFRLVIEDDGIGFEPASLNVRHASDGGFGLFNIRERLDYLGGKFKIKSAPGQGSRFTLLAPLRLDAPETC